MERSFIDTMVRAANDELRLAHDGLDAAKKGAPAGEGSELTGALDLVRSHMNGAQQKIAELGRHLDADGPVEPPPEMRACQACGRSIRAAATLCGFCWTKR